MKPVHFLALSVAFALLFTLFPGIDRAFAHLFYDPARGGFFLKDLGLVQFSYGVLVPALVWAVVALLAALVAIRLLPIPALARYRVRWSVIIYIFLSFAIGPGLVTNGILKNHWGRARPAQTVEFGGTKTFSPALIPSNQCDHNCSFVTGHGTMGFFFVTFALLLAPGRRRRAAIAGAVALGTLIGLGRTMQGAHWLSDVVFAGIINIAIAWALYRWIIVHDGLSGPGLRRLAGRLRDRLGTLPRNGPGGLAAWRARVARLPGSPERRAAVLFSPLLVLAAIGYVTFDRPITRLVGDMNPALHEMFVRISDLAYGGRWYVMAVLICGGLWWRATREGTAQDMAMRLKGWSMVPLFAITAVTASGAVGLVMKIVLGRARPVEYLLHDIYGFQWFRMNAHFWSFPSGHASLTVSLMTALYFLAPRSLPVCIVVSLAVMAARVVVHAHYVSDVLAGAYVAVVVTTWLRGVFARSGIDLGEAARGRYAPRAGVGWRERLGLPT